MKKPSPQIWLLYLQKIKHSLKNNPTILEICNKYNISPDDLDLAPIKFDDIDTSAATNKGVITLNWKLLDKENRDQIPAYICHEWAHYCQQSNKPTQSADDGNYLENPSEQEAFKFQIKFINEEDGFEEANEYTDQVLDHHEEKGKERQKKKEKLMEFVD